MIIEKGTVEKSSIEIDKEPRFGILGIRIISENFYNEDDEAAIDLTLDELKILVTDLNKQIKKLEEPNT